MAVGLTNQIERRSQHFWGDHKSHKWAKQKKHRRERFRARRDPETPPLYRKYWDFEY